jgi:hypothetical protein
MLVGDGSDGLELAKTLAIASMNVGLISKCWYPRCRSRQKHCVIVGGKGDVEV